MRACLGAEQDVEDDEDGADGDGRIGDVEGRPMISAEQNFEEIGNSTADDAVGDVAGGAAKKKSQAGGGEAAAMSRDEKPREDADDENRAGNQCEPHPRRAGIREDAESDTWIPAVNQVDEIVEKLAAITFGRLRLEPGFRGSVEEDDGESEPEPANASGQVQSFTIYRGAARLRQAGMPGP